MKYSDKQVERFWSKVSLSGSAECWPWLMSVTSKGYGQVGLTVGGVSRILKAHKVAWEIANNLTIPDGARATHSCKNRLCCNPRHVIISSNGTNTYTGGKGHARGQKHGKAKLTDDQVRTIKYKLTGLSTRQIAALLGVKYNAIWDIRKGKTWAHI
jgi:hypothetical protein